LFPVFHNVTFLSLSQDEAISSVFLDPAAAQFLLGELKAIKTVNSTYFLIKNYRKFE
jgi:hypothetical protein